MDHSISPEPAQISQPPADSFGCEWEGASPRQYFDPQTVVSRDALGRPVSLYGSDTWDYAATSADGTSGATLRFFTSPASSPELVATLREQQKALTWLYIDAGDIRAFITIRNANLAASAWCQKALARGVDLFSLLANPEWVIEELETLNRNYLHLSSSLITVLWRNRKMLGLEVQVPLQQIRKAINEESRARPEFNQTPLIPSRIYCGILAGLIAGMDEIERDLDAVLDAFRQSVAVSRSGLEVGKPLLGSNTRPKALAAVAERMKALGYDSIRCGALDNFIAGRINYYQTVLMHVVVAFTGMRKGEVAMVPLNDVLEPFQDRGTTHWVINGYTRKLNRGVKKPASWITSREGCRAVTLAQRIAKTIQDEVGGEARAGQEALLFPSIEDPFRAKSASSTNTARTVLAENICPVVTQEDIDELNLLELDRGWQREGIEVGKRWPLAFHQLRRSLSVYAHRSGMVSLPSLKAQLQHITDEMRAYYADGYSHAVNLVFDKDHFSHEWNAAKAESSYFGYAMGLLFSDEDLFGQGAVRMAQAVSTRPRQETLKLFKEGKLAYKETALGGCVSIDECKALPLEPIPFDCLKTDCVNLVVFSKRLDHVIRTQDTLVATLERDECGSVEHRLELGSLRVLLKARQTFQEGRA